MFLYLPSCKKLLTPKVKGRLASLGRHCTREDNLHIQIPKKWQFLHSKFKVYWDWYNGICYPLVQFSKCAALDRIHKCKKKKKQPRQVITDGFTRGDFKGDFLVNLLSIFCYLLLRFWSAYATSRIATTPHYVSCTETCTCADIMTGRWPLEAGEIHLHNL